MNCIICNKVFTGIENLKQHEASEKHKKKVEMQKLLTSDSKTNLNNVNEIPEMQCLQTVSCPPCSKTFSNLTEFQNHCVSEEHARMVLKEKSANKESPISECSVSSSLDLKKEISKLDLKPDQHIDFSRCNICSKAFSGPESYFQHMASAAHKKKSLAANSSASESALSQLECKMCSKTFSGPEPYQQHLDSANHKKKLLLASYMNEAPPVVAPHKYTIACYACKENFDDPELYQQHINTDNHKNQSIYLLNAKSNLMGVLSCDVCDKQFTGPVPYDQHMKSEVHKKKVYLKYMMQQAGEDKENKVGSLHETVNPESMPIDYYCNYCKKQCTNATAYAEHASSVQHTKKFVESEVELKKKEIQNLFSSKLSDSSVGSLREMTQSEDEKAIQKSMNGNPGINSANRFETFLFGEDAKCFSTIPVNYNIAIFQVGDEIDFDRKTNDNDILDNTNGEDIMYDECPSP